MLNYSTCFVFVLKIFSKQRYLTGKVDDRVAILVSGKPELENPKLLGIPVISSSTGTAQHDAVMSLLANWDVKEKVVGLVFDTTSSNTGRIKGCATNIERTLGRAVLWFACRHHMYEIHVKHVSDCIIGKRNSPSEALFVRFKKEWPDFNQNPAVRSLVFKNKVCYNNPFLKIMFHHLTLFDWEVSSELTAIGNEVLEWASNCLETDTFPRSDYLELVELTVLFWGGAVFPFSFRKPGKTV